MNIYRKPAMEENSVFSLIFIAFVILVVFIVLTVFCVMIWNIYIDQYKVKETNIKQT